MILSGEKADRNNFVGEEEERRSARRVLGDPQKQTDWDSQQHPVTHTSCSAPVFTTLTCQNTCGSGSDCLLHCKLVLACEIFWWHLAAAPSFSYPCEKVDVGNLAQRDYCSYFALLHC